MCSVSFYETVYVNMRPNPYGDSLDRPQSGNSLAGGSHADCVNEKNWRARKPDHPTKALRASGRASRAASGPGKASALQRTHGAFGLTSPKIIYEMSS